MNSAAVDLAAIVLDGMDSPGSGQNEDENEIVHCNGNVYVFADWFPYCLVVEAQGYSPPPPLASKKI